MTRALDVSRCKPLCQRLCRAVLCCGCRPLPGQTKDQPELTIPSPEVCHHLGPQLVGAAAVVLSQLLASYIEGINEDTFLTADSSVFSSSAGGWVHEGRLTAGHSM